MNRKIIKLFLAILLVIALTLSVACSAKPEIIEFAPEFSQERMIETIKILSAEDGGRIAGFAGEAAVAEFISNKFESIGLEVSEQSFPVKAYTCNNQSVTVTSDGNKIIQDSNALLFSAATPSEGIVAELVPLGMGADNDYTDKDVNGKIALISRGGEYFFVKTERAYNMGAAAVIFYDPNSDSVISATLTQLSAIPAISIARTEAEKFEKSIAEGMKVEVRIVVDSIHEDSSSMNVIGLYKSLNNPKGMSVIVGAHYDGVNTPAANDNASGTSVIIEMAMALVEQKVPLPYDVKFIAFGAEEIGLIGSNVYVNRMSKKEKESVLAMLNFDMVGVGDSFELFTADGGEATSLIDISTEVLKQMGYTPMISKTDRSDHSPFSYAGMEAVYVAVGPFKDYHTDFDTHEAIQPEMLVKVCEFGTKILIEELPKWIN